MHLSKHHGLGNDFLVAFADEVPVSGADLARGLCHRTTGIGADGLIFATPSTQADLTMTLFNADGSPAEISGNGIRCLAQALARSRGTDHVDVVIDSGGRSRALQVRPTSDPRTLDVSAEMGPVGPGPEIGGGPAFGRGDLGALRAVTADVGNPHLVIEVTDLAHVDASIDGPAIEALWDPTGINVHFVRATGPDELTMVHWERGAGATMACGSGATVAATIAEGWGLVGSKVSVNMPGGTAEVVVGPPPTLGGPVVHVADIEVSDG